MHIILVIVHLCVLKAPDEYVKCFSILMPSNLSGLQRVYSSVFSCHDLISENQNCIFLRWENMFVITS